MRPVEVSDLGLVVTRDMDFSLALILMWHGFKLFFGFMVLVQRSIPRLIDSASTYLPGVVYVE